MKLLTWRHCLLAVCIVLLLLDITLGQVPYASKQLPFRSFERVLLLEDKADCLRSIQMDEPYFS